MYHRGSDAITYDSISKYLCVVTVNSLLQKLLSDVNISEFGIWWQDSAQ